MVQESFYFVVEIQAILKESTQKDLCFGIQELILQVSLSQFKDRNYPSHDIKYKRYFMKVYTLRVNKTQF